MAKTPLFQFTLRPNRRVKRIWTECPAADLKRASSQALYEGSPYHRRRQSGQLSATRGYPFASKCDPKWTIAEATKALRAGIAAGRVSDDWRNGFPRHVWYKDVTVVYEAVLHNEVAGTYHAYPLKEEEWPHGL